MNEKDKIYQFWFSNRVYKGKIVSEDETHWIIFDKKINKEIALPKATTSREEWGGEI